MNQETIDFLREREEKLGSKIRYKTYCTWYGRLGHEIREYGIFLYTDGKTVIYEDFDREPMIMGIPIKRKNKEKYEKLEVSFPVSSLESITQVTWASAARSLENEKDLSVTPSGLSRAVRRLATKLVLSDGTVIFLETLKHKEIAEAFKGFREEL